VNLLLFLYNNMNTSTTTLTSTLNANLSALATVCTIILLGILLYRITHVVCFLIVSAVLVIFPTQKASSSSSLFNGPLHRFAQLGLIGHAAQFLVLVFMAAIHIAIAAGRSILFICYAMLPLLVLSTVLVLMQEQWSSCMLVLVDIFNGPFSSTLHAYILAPLAILDKIGTLAIPVFNFFVFVLLQIPMQLLVWFLHGGGASHLGAALNELALAAPTLTLAAKTFIEANTVTSCKQEYCVNLTEGGVSCVYIGSNVASQACLRAATREFDFNPTFSHLQQTASHIILSLGSSCDAIALLSNITLYPITDPSSWRALDRLLNAILSAAVSAPTSAALRCSLAGGFIQRPAMVIIYHCIVDIIFLFYFLLWRSMLIFFVFLYIHMAGSRSVYTRLQASI